MAKKKAEKIDGMSPTVRAKIRSAIRQVWSRSYARRLVIARSMTEEGYPRCEKCGLQVPKISVDHIIPVGDILNGGIERMFVPSTGLQALCKKCHAVKTKADNANTRKEKKKCS